MNALNLGQDPTSIIAAVNSAASALKSIGKLFSGLFGGKTQYISEPKASAITNSINNPFLTIVRNLHNQDEIKYVYGLIDKVFEVTGASIDPIKKWYDHLRSYGDLLNSPNLDERAAQRLHAATRFFVMNIGANDDLTFQKNFSAWYVEPILNTYLMQPLTKYITAKYGAAALDDLKKNVPPPPVDSGNILPALKSPVGIGTVLALAAGSFYFLTRKKKR